jgi:small-conductance mechanosensitive channel
VVAVTLQTTGTESLLDVVARIDYLLVAEAILLLLLAYATARLVDWGLSELADRRHADRFRLTLLIPVVNLLIYAFAVATIVLFLVNPQSEQLLAFSGVLGAALGFGIRDLVADFFGSLVLIVERPYRIGDKVSVGEHYGEVVDIGIRSTRIRTPDDDLVSVPNYQFLEKTVANANAGNAEMQVTVEFYLSPVADVWTPRRILEEALITSRYVYVTDDLPVTTRVEDDRYHRTLRGRAYVNDLRNEQAFRTDVTERVLEAFAERGIRSAQPPVRGAGGTAPEATAPPAEHPGE